jgi:hypothetical protein
MGIRDSDSSIRVDAIHVFLSAESGPAHSSRTAMVSAGQRSSRAMMPLAKRSIVGVGSRVGVEVDMMSDAKQEKSPGEVGVDGKIDISESLPGHPSVWRFVEFATCIDSRPLTSGRCCILL